MICPEGIPSLYIVYHVLSHADQQSLNLKIFSFDPGVTQHTPQKKPYLYLFGHFVE